VRQWAKVVSLWGRSRLGSGEVHLASARVRSLQMTTRSYPTGMVYHIGGRTSEGQASRGRSGCQDMVDAENMESLPVLVALLLCYQ